MDAVDIEGAEAFLDQIGEIGGERRLLELVFADQEVNRVGRAGRNLLANDSGSHRHRARLKPRAPSPGRFEFRTPPVWR